MNRKLFLEVKHDEKTEKNKLEERLDNLKIKVEDSAKRTDRLEEKMMEVKEKLVTKEDVIKIIDDKLVNLNKQSIPTYSSVTSNIQDQRIQNQTKIREALVASKEYTSKIDEAIERGKKDRFNAAFELVWEDNEKYQDSKKELINPKLAFDTAVLRVENLSQISELDQVDFQLLRNNWISF